MKNILVSLSLVLLLAGCKGLAVTTTQDYKSETNFKAYKTFAFYPGKFVTDTVSEARKAEAQKIFIEDVTGYLSKKGMSYDEKNPDIVITFVAGAKTVTEVQSHTPSEDPGRYGQWKPGQGGEDFWKQEYREGTLVIGVYDFKAREFVWGAYSSTTIYGTEGGKKFKAAIKKSFNRFPPNQ